jgi:hypothetical protein
VRIAIAVALQIVGGDRDAGTVQAGAGEAAGLGEGQDVGAIVAADAQDDGGLGALGLPVPVLGVDERPVGGGGGQGDEAGAAIDDLGGVAAQAGAQVGAGGKFQDFGSGVEEGDILERDAGAFGDAAHLGDEGIVERLDHRQVVGDQGGGRGGVEAEAAELLAVMAQAALDARGGLGAVLDAALVRRAGDVDQGAGLGHGVALLRGGMAAGDYGPGAATGPSRPWFVLLYEIERLAEGSAACHWTVAAGAAGGRR